MGKSPKYFLGCSWEEAKKKVDAGEWQFHGYPQGFALTEIRLWPQEKVCLVHFLSGEDFGSWKDELSERLKTFAKEQGCSALQAGCRLGLEKTLKGLGWKRWHVVMRLEL